MKLAITGCPRSGKTTHAETLGGVIKHTDDLMNLSWGAASEEACRWLDGEFDIIEGVTVVRALRRWLDQNVTNKDKPVDKVMYLRLPLVSLTKGQERMRKGMDTMWLKIKNSLIDRGVEVEEVNHSFVDKKQGVASPTHAPYWL